MENKRFFYTYNKKLMKHLRRKGIGYHTTGLSVTSRGQFWMYDRLYETMNVVEEFFAGIKETREKVKDKCNGKVESKDEVRLDGWGIAIPDKATVSKDE